tara:strand:+ start:2129 stop:2494 length:366 start_codon:yes stop_codon:yes gene_type:complete
MKKLVREKARKADETIVEIDSRRRWDLAFVLGFMSALLVLYGGTLPQLAIPDHVSDPLYSLDAWLNLEPDAGAMVPVFAFVAILFCLVHCYRWIILCALMVIAFALFAAIDQFETIMGLTV